MTHTQLINIKHSFGLTIRRYILKVLRSHQRDWKEVEKQYLLLYLYSTFLVLTLQFFIANTHSTNFTLAFVF